MSVKSISIREQENELHHLDALDTCGVLRLMQATYDIPSLAAWRATEFALLRHLQFESPVLELGCGNGRFSSLLLKKIDCGIDLSPKEVRLCLATGAYSSVECMDARALAFETGSFKTVFANCVIEHIPSLDRVLQEVHRVLEPGGKVIATVPLRGMNRNLLLPWKWYSDLRARQLAHLNLLSKQEWMGAFENAGFSGIATMPYASGDFCRRWDRVDGIMCAGFGRLAVARLYKLALWAMPNAGRRAIDRFWHRWFLPGVESDPSRDTAAMVIVASA